MPDPITSQILEHRHELFAYVYANVRDYHAAEDLFQEIATIIVDKARKTDEPIRDFRAWAKQIARFEMLNHYRRRDRQAANLPVEEMISLTGDLYLRDTPDPAELVEEKDALDRCLQELPEKSARIIRLRFAESLPHAKIAAQLKQTEAAVRQTARRARLALADCVRQRLGMTEEGAGG